MQKDKTNKYVFIIVIMIIASIFFFADGIVSWFTSTPYKAKFVLGIFFLVGSILYPIIRITLDTKKEISNDKKNEEKNFFSQESILEKSAIETRQAEERFMQEIQSAPLFSIKYNQRQTQKRTMSDMPQIHISNVTRATNVDALFPLVVIDTETTGISKKNKIIEVSALKYDVGFRLVSRFSTLINPQKPIPAEATAVNHITDEMVAQAPPFSAIVDSLQEFINGCTIVGHNLIFDLEFLFLAGLDLPPKVKYIDTLDLAKKTLRKEGSKKYNHHTGEYEDCDEFDVYDYKLETLCNYYFIQRPLSHRSDVDCHATAKLLEKLLNDKVSYSPSTTFHFKAQNTINAQYIDQLTPFDN